MFHDSMKMVGDVTIERFTDGVLQETRQIKNLVVQSGKVFTASRIIDATAPVMSHMAIGTDSSVPVSTNDELGAQIARVALTSASSTDNVVTFIAPFPAGVGTGALTEAGIFNDATVGTMLARTTFAVVNKAANDSITITWNITIQ